jgi:hypothetical protein
MAKFCLDVQKRAKERRPKFRDQFFRRVTSSSGSIAEMTTGRSANCSSKQAAHYAQEHAARLRREAANMVHVVVVAAQLLVHRGRSRWWLGDDGVGAQNDKQMPLPEANLTARVTMVRCVRLAHEISALIFR